MASYSEQHVPPSQKSARVAHAIPVVSGSIRHLEKHLETRLSVQMVRTHSGRHVYPFAWVISLFYFPKGRGVVGEFGKNVSRSGWTSSDLETPTSSIALRISQRNSTTTQ